MAKLDNPAGRLHEILSTYRAEASDGIPIVDVWKAVFEVEDRRETMLRVAETAGLIPQIEVALERSGDDDQVGVFVAFSGSWLSGVLLPRDDHYVRPSKAASHAVDPSALAALGGVSSFLSATASEGQIPDWEVIHDLHEQVRKLIDGIVGDPSLPEDVKRLALNHAHRLAAALSHFRIGGPGAVRAATEQLIGSVRLAPDSVQRSSVWQRVGDMFGRAWTVFSRVPQAQQSLEALPELLRALPGGDS